MAPPWEVAPREFFMWPRYTPILSIRSQARRPSGPTFNSRAAPQAANPAPSGWMKMTLPVSGSDPTTWATPDWGTIHARKQAAATPGAARRDLRNMVLSSCPMDG